MKLEINNQPVYIQFNHLRWNNNMRTECRIWRDQDLLGVGEVKRYAKDTNDKSTARKYALKKAIDAIPHRGDRTALWQAYWAEREKLTGRKWVA